MRHTRLAVISWMLLLGGVALAQAPPVPSDPVSGTWRARGRPYLDLTLAPGDAVAGSVFIYWGPTEWRVPIKSGSFDRRAGTIRLEGEGRLRDADVTPYVIQGIVERDTMRVQFAIGPNEGSLVMSRAPQDASARSREPGTVLITGSNRGLGLEFAKQYAERGWTVIATARSPESASELKALAGKDGRVTVEKLDLLDRPGIEALAAKYRGRPIDLLINNAGVLGDIKAQTLGSLDYDEFEEVMAVNVYGALAVAEAFQDNVAASGQKKIVSITSGSGILSRPVIGGPYFYNASKAALNMVMRGLATDLRDRGVTVVALAPGTANTDMRREAVGAEQAARDPRPADAVAAMMKVIDRLTMDDTSALLNVDGRVLPW
jgi:NAD(P)-dependent dehydrogenase (short-subunit alcohol dehydrogenase family)